MMDLCSVFAADAASSESPLAGWFLLARGGVSPARPERQRGHAFTQDDQRLHLLKECKQLILSTHGVLFNQGRRDCALVVCLCALFRWSCSPFLLLLVLRCL